MSVIVCTYNRKAILKRCVEALFRQDLPALEYEVMVVVDGSTDGTEAMLQNLQETAPPCSFRWIRQENQGAAAARNRGAKEARGEVLLFLDDDIIAAPGLIAEHAKSQQAGNPLVLGNIPLYPLGYGDYMTEGTRAWAQAQFEKMGREDYEITFLDIYFANASIQRKLFFELGGFDEEFRRYGMEDRELAYRLLRAGIRPVYHPKAVGSQIYLKDFHTYCDNYYWAGRGEVKLVRKHPELWPSMHLSRYHQARLIRRVGRWAALQYPRMMAWVMAILKRLMEKARGLHLKGAFLTRLQSFVRDYFYWRGVREEVGGIEEFLSFLDPRP